jgi:hypothetical protein
MPYFKDFDSITEISSSESGDMLIISSNLLSNGSEFNGKIQLGSPGPA